MALNNKNKTLFLERKLSNIKDFDGFDENFTTRREVRLTRFLSFPPILYSVYYCIIITLQNEAQFVSNSTMVVSKINTLWMYCIFNNCSFPELSTGFYILLNFYFVRDVLLKLLITVLVKLGATYINSSTLNLNTMLVF